MTDMFEKYFASFIKHSAWAALCVAILWFVRNDVLLPMMGSLQDMADTMRSLERGQDRLLYHTVKGSWRATDPPDEAPAVPAPPPTEEPRTDD